MVSQVTRQYADIHTWDNLYAAYRAAAAGKRSQPAVAGFEYRLEDNLIALQEELAAEKYRPGAYHNFTIHEPKQRLISAAPFRDRVVHHALCQLIEPAFEAGFIHHSYANRIGKGTHRALDACQGWARNYAYVLPCDIVQFFPAIDHTLLRRTLNRRIQDAALRRLIALILTSGAGVHSETYDMVYFPGDDLLAAARPRGLPIGNLTSQFWANCYLDSFDHFVTRELGCTAYLRYMDDFLLFADDKATLWCWRAVVVERLAALRLTLHDTQAHPRPVREGIPFLGFVVYSTHRRLKRRVGIAFQRKLAGLLAAYRRGEMPRTVLEASLRGWINHVHYGDTWGLRKALLKRVRVGPETGGKETGASGGANKQPTEDHLQARM